MQNARIFVYAMLVAAISALSLPAVSIAADVAIRPAAVSGAKHKVIVQVSDPRKRNLALNNVKNVQDDLGKKNV